MAQGLAGETLGMSLAVMHRRRVAKYATTPEKLHAYELLYGPFTRQQKLMFGWPMKGVVPDGSGPTQRL